jgi:branched-chain amino acid transport system permease protein
MANRADRPGQSTLVGPLIEVLRPFGNYRMILYSVLLIVLMLTRPQGLFAWPLWKKKTA